MSFFLDPDVTLNSKLVEILYMLMGVLCARAGVKGAADKGNRNRLFTGAFWVLLGVLFFFGKWLPPVFSGILVLLMCVPAVLGKVRPGSVKGPTREESDAGFKKIGYKLFIPAFTGGFGSLIFGFISMSPLVGLLFGILAGIALLMIFNRENKPAVFLEDNRRFLDIVGALSMLPMLLACLGAVFTKAGVGDAVASLVEKVIPAGNVNIGILVYGVGMMLFTMIMGNAFAAITVLTVGIGAPFVLAYGADPVLICSVAMTCGYCGTLMTPMAANFNIVPVAILEIKDRNGVIKKQVLMGLIMLAFQLGYMILFK